LTDVTPEATPCPVCGGRELVPAISPTGVRVVRCTACGHRVAAHDAGSGPHADYHEQYDGGAFLEALRATRVRQADRLIELLRRHVPHLSGVVDYGAGRGWFLEACRSAGVGPLAGVDTSPVSVAGLAGSGIEAGLLAADETGSDALARLTFRPRVVTLLDVVEHFPPETLRSRLRSIVAACGPELEIVAMKVPVAGLLYGAAASLCAAGAPRLLGQLYQAGTWPPHFNYFSRTSAARLLESAGLAVVARAGDPDFEPDFLGSRVGATGPAARAMARAGGEVLSAAIRVSGKYDTLVLLARPVRDAGS
jgi:Zn ribbon nucleic-acid-binding protein